MDRAKPYSSLVVSGSKLSLLDGDPFPDPSDFRSAVGALQYLTWTRPDIAFAITQVCQFLHNLTTTHWTAVKWILWYIKGTFNHGIFFQQIFKLVPNMFLKCWLGR